MEMETDGRVQIEAVTPVSGLNTGCPGADWPGKGGLWPLLVSGGGISHNINLREWKRAAGAPGTQLATLQNNMKTGTIIFVADSFCISCESKCTAKVNLGPFSVLVLTSWSPRLPSTHNNIQIGSTIYFDNLDNFVQKVFTMKEFLTQIKTVHFLSIY